MSSITARARVRANYLDVSVSHGTHRHKDLIESFSELLNRLDEVRYKKRFKKEVELALRTLGGDGYADASVEQEFIIFLLEELFDELDACAPSGYYFGAHMGDGSDFGFWVSEEEE